jgi:hypothetical protein
MSLYISLSTVPKRMGLWDSFEQNLTSLVNQKTDLDYKIILNIPYIYNITKEEYVIHENLLNFQKQNPKLIINRTEDYGPITKIIGSFNISKDPEDVLLICDDDQAYNEGMLDYQLKMQEKYNKQYITCFRGDIPAIKVEATKEDGTKGYMLSSYHTYFPVKEDFRLVVPGHWHSVCYQRSFFGEDFLDKDFLSLCDNDDFLIAYYMKKKAIPIMCVNWDKETDYTPVNHDGRPSWTFPINKHLSYDSCGFDEFRRMAGHHFGRYKPEWENFIHKTHQIYTV